MEPDTSLLGSTTTRPRTEETGQMWPCQPVLLTGVASRTLRVPLTCQAATDPRGTTSWMTTSTRRTMTRLKPHGLVETQLESKSSGSETPRKCQISIPIRTPQVVLVRLVSSTQSMELFWEALLNMEQTSSTSILDLNTPLME